MKYAYQKQVDIFPFYVTLGNINCDTGVGEEFDLICYNQINTLTHFFKPISRLLETSPIKFYMLKDEWEVDTTFLSSITEISMHPAYQQIIGMGKTAIPYILTELQNKPGHWFWALKCITGEDPTPPEYKGNINEMTQAWLNWGRENNYLR